PDGWRVRHFDQLETRHIDPRDRNRLTPDVARHPHESSFAIARGKGALGEGRRGMEGELCRITLPEPSIEKPEIDQCRGVPVESAHSAKDVDAAAGRHRSAGIERGSLEAHCAHAGPRAIARRIFMRGTTPYELSHLLRTRS